MGEKREEGTSANKGRSRGACTQYISLCASMDSNVVLYSPGERHHHHKGKHCGCRGRDLLALVKSQQKEMFFME